MRCAKCGNSDSHAQFIFVDRNGCIITESQLEAFRILHPDSNIQFQRVFLCGLCIFELTSTNS